MQRGPGPLSLGQLHTRTILSSPPGPLSLGQLRTRTILSSPPGPLSTRKTAHQNHYPIWWEEVQWGNVLKRHITYSPSDKTSIKLLPTRTTITGTTSHWDYTLLSTRTTGKLLTRITTLSGGKKSSGEMS